MLASHIKPSWKQGFARSLGQSAAPSQYPPFMWCPSLGPSGAVPEVRNQSAAGTLSGSSYWAPDGVRHTVTSNGDEIVVPYNARMFPTTGLYTIEYLVRVDVGIGNFGPTISHGGHGGTFNIQYKTNTNEYKALATLTTSACELASGVPFVAGTTQHLIFVIDGSVNTDGRLYIDGQLKGTDTSVVGTLVWDTDNIEIGKRVNGTTFGFALWPGIALSPGEVARRSKDFFAPLRLRRRLAASTAAPPAFGGVSNIIGGGITV